MGQASVFGFPPVVTAADVVGWNAADEFHRYELSLGGVLSVAPVPGGEHAKIASQLMFWLADSISPRTLVRQNVGIWVTSQGRVGYRVPDLVVVRDDDADESNLNGDLVRLAVEIASESTEATDLGAKVTEYALAGVERYWTVTRGPQPRVTRRVLQDDGTYRAEKDYPLAWMLAQTDATAMLWPDH